MPASDIACALDALAEDLSVRPIDTDIRERAHGMLSLVKGLGPAADVRAIRDLSEWLFRVVYWTPSPNALRMIDTADAIHRLRHRVFQESQSNQAALMSATEAAVYLRLDCKDAYQALYRLRKKKLVKATRIGGRIMYRRDSLDEFIDWRTEDHR